MEKTMHIAFCCDENYIIPASIMLESLFRSNRDIHIVVHTFSDDLSGSAVGKLEAQIQQYGGDLVLHKLPAEVYQVLEQAPRTRSDMPVAIYYRLLLPYVVEETVEKLLYLDCDVLVRRNLYRSYFEHRDDKAISGVRDIGEVESCKRLGQKQHINAGVLVMNLAKIREMFTQTQILNEINRLIGENRLKYADQDAINTLFEGEIGILPDMFNYQKGIHKMYALKHRRERRAACVVHFITGDKPWRGTYCFPFAREYYSLLRGYLSVPQRICWWFLKPVGLAQILQKHLRWRRSRWRE